MGAWGPAIFSDDTACDIRGDYRELLEDQVPDDEATQQTIDAYAHLGEDEKHAFWLVLAAAQSALGRLDDNVKTRALEVIDRGIGLELWEEEGPRELAKRKASLAKLRTQLTGEQPVRKAVRRPWRDVTELAAGDVLAFETAGTLRLLRVLRIDDHRVGIAPIVGWLDWAGNRVPSERKIRKLKVRMRAHDGLRSTQARSDTYRVARHRKKDPDWAGLGFKVVAHLRPRPEDTRAEAWSYTAWTGLARILESDRGA
ncbi:hypothetical protein [Nocardioides jejuensis]|uniref:DUF4259 domain-containing protein n=1 Tax=Nocardioides jejuensis TaxID=2502782 RepID=A0A4R1CKP9_9ACTN|nr:hypothetical protein [Nocardioides jejuensis]TCJ30786.1 hypothetical protein EPD65_01755 [Nocardioides jejuensis]